MPYVDIDAADQSVYLHSDMRAILSTDRSMRPLLDIVAFISVCKDAQAVLELHCLHMTQAPLFGRPGLHAV